MQNEPLHPSTRKAKPLVYGSVCSGIEAATAAWHTLGWQPAFFSEIDNFPRAVLQHHYPHVPLHGDFTTIKDDSYAAIDLLVGGTPCQAFSVAGLRKGFADERGNLTLEFVRLAQRLKPRWLVWENVPGVLSIDRGRAFGSFLGGLAELGYGFAYRVLDAQHFGVPQRRRRVFVVGHLGDWRPPAAVLFERESLLRDITPSRETRQRLAPTISARPTGGGGLGTDFDLDGGLIHAPELARCVATREGSSQDWETTTMVAHALRAEGFDASEDGTGRGTPLVPVTFPWQSARDPGAGGEGISGTLVKNQVMGLQLGSAVRRLTPRECERLQGFPDDYTLVPHRGKPAADGPRYKALGNSMAVPVMAWVGQRINLIEEMLNGTKP